MTASSQSGGAICRGVGRISAASSLIWFGFARPLPARARRRRPQLRRRRSRTATTSSTSRRASTHRLYELTFQHFVDQRHLLETAVSWTYWNSEFTVVGLAVLWVYLRRHDAFFGFRNSILLANVIGLIGYVFVPTAPPRLLGARVRRPAPRRPRPARREPVRGDAEPARRRRADRRRRARARLPALVVEGALGGLAGLGLVRRDGDRQPLLARLRRRDRRRDPRDGGRLPARRIRRALAARRA